MQLLRINKYFIMLLILSPTLLGAFIPIENFSYEIVIIISIVQLLLLILWLYIIGSFLYRQNINGMNSLNIFLFKMNTIVIITFSALLLFMLFFRNVIDVYPILKLIILIISLWSFWGILYLIYFVSKAIVIYEYDKNKGKTNNWFSTFIKFIFLPLAIINLQGKIQKIEIIQKEDI